MDELRISIVQSPIVWENKEANLHHFYTLLKPLKGQSDLAVLPETFTTGFSVTAGELAESNNDDTVKQIQAWADELDLAIAGSFLAKNSGDWLPPNAVSRLRGNDSENDSGNDNKGGIFNRGFFIAPHTAPVFVDKRHLFRLGGETELLTAGTTRPIITYKDWNIRLIVCYDLRFPVWMHNRATGDSDSPVQYDLLICTANWPHTRDYIWTTLLQARAIENWCYVCGVNRIGEDGNGVAHAGNSVLFDFWGKARARAEANQEAVITTKISKQLVTNFRQRFPMWKDADAFELK
ncbi:MAG: nitrilase family protein [Candidatus Symbiothrix sp.]|jgi:predicted amidohydrolase|nr:nitrilase family protein [Candidatus Symbiothrix sp.]